MQPLRQWSCLEVAAFPRSVQFDIPPALEVLEPELMFPLLQVDALLLDVTRRVNAVSVHYLHAIHHDARPVIAREIEAIWTLLRCDQLAGEDHSELVLVVVQLHLDEIVFDLSGAMRRKLRKVGQLLPTSQI